MPNFYATALDYLRGTPVDDFDARIAKTPGIGGNLAKMLRALGGVLLPSPEGDTEFIERYSHFHATMEVALPPVPLTDGYDKVRESIITVKHDLYRLGQLQATYIEDQARPTPSTFIGNYAGKITTREQELAKLMTSAGISDYSSAARERWLITSGGFVWSGKESRNAAVRDRIRERLLKIVGQEGLEGTITQTLMNTHIAQGIRAFNGMANAIGTSEFHALQYNPMDKDGTPIMATDLFEEAETRTRTFLENALLGVGGRSVT